MKPPCMFAHAVISSDERRAEARGRDRARREAPAHHAAASGSASMCGRASRLAVTSPRPSPTVATSGAPRRSRAALRPTISAAAAAAAPVRSTTPLQPPTRKASVMQHFGQPFMRDPRRARHRRLNGSTCGAARWAMIHSPVARCEKVSPSPSTAGEKAASANMAIAIAARPSPAKRASAPSSLAERTNGTAKDIASSLPKRQ